MWAILLACLALIAGARIAGPSALQRFDQPKTVAYTASAVLDRQWLLPGDTMGRLSTKPPLVNWMAAPVVGLGFWTEWAVKLPMLVASVATLLMVVGMARHLLARCPETAARAAEGSVLAGLAWLATPATAESIYHCRPDPVLVAFLAGAWALATLAMEGDSRRPGWVKAGLWICVGLAGLTKGPPALLPMLYIPLAARWIYGRGSAARTGWKWGVPLALGIVGLWLVPVIVWHAHHFFHVLLGQEMAERVAGVGGRFGNADKGGGPLSLLTGLYRNPVWLVQKTMPWSLAALGALWMIGPRRWPRHPLAPAALWILLVLGFFSLTAGKTADYILPAYPAVAILAAYGCLRLAARFRFSPALFGGLGAAVVVALSLQALWWSAAARDRLGEQTKAFAREAALVTGGDRIAFVDTGYNTLQFFLGRHQPGPPGEEALAAARWIVLPVHPALKAERTSGAIPGVGGGGKPGRLGLYRADGEGVREEAARRLALRRNESGR